MKALLFAAVVLFSTPLLAQGDDNLLMQYNRGPDLDGYYHPWNVGIALNGFWMNTDRDYTKAGISLGGGLLIQHNFSKSFGLQTGVRWLPIHYSYQREDNTSKDRIRYYEIPLLGRLSPSRRLSFVFGPTYNRLEGANNSAVLPPENESTAYPQGRFQNVYGALLGGNYLLWKGIHIGVHYRYLKKDTPPLQLQSNSFSGWSLELQYYFKNPLKKPKL